jgi:hypothetical protein
VADRVHHTPTTLAGLKRQAKKLSRDTGCKHVHALDRIARSMGFPTYKAAQAALSDGGVRG